MTIKGEERSAYVAAFQPGTFTSSESLGYTLINIQNQNTAFNVVKDGKEIVNGVMAPDGKIIQGKLATVDGKQVILDGFTSAQQVYAHLNASAIPASWTQCGGWECMNDCLSSQGIAGKAIEIASLTCAALLVSWGLKYVFGVL